jgi:2-polyprenyl-6-methoxyphenol hydroxylase-like FAD-dependent oxidoreductase
MLEEENEPMSSPSAVIIGAGIAGPAMGVALRRLGLDATVYEATDAPRDQAGAFMNLAPNGLAALKALGLERVLDGLGFQNDHLTFQNETGRELADLPVGGITLLRGRLSRALREAAERAGVRFVFGKSLHTIETHGHGVVARFTDGASVPGRFLIGADGIHSRVRVSWFLDAPQPAYTGIINLGGVATTDLPSTGTAMRMIFGRRGFFGYAVQPSGETYWFSNFAQTREPSRLDLHNVTARDYREQLLDLHRDDPPEVPQILHSVSGNVGCYAIYDIASLPAWHRGHVCLIGDAAHAIGPHVGQGASLALEDAVVLAKCLRDVPEATSAFATFEAIRRPRVEPIVRQSRMTGRQKAPAGWIGRRIRDLVLPIFLRQSAKAAAVMYQYPLDWNEPVAGLPSAAR